ncbi:uncharacterized protein LOC106172311 [Lingula anatina]|uniref:Uncharacterized protein LOC106172311 n=1 Tax=Lingula anatina TaxID=7574 RepID=A0A1S3JDC8_LINAN|nr:uncharacterized protein LOC106172311 [Lingula anatina]|eukprot:XP_013408412.1 uncharacterized protein LOC106172311 [Lingula anatina]
MRQQAFLIGVAFMSLVILFLGVDGAEILHQEKLNEEDHSAGLKSRSKRSGLSHSDDMSSFFATAGERDLRRFTSPPRSGKVDCTVEVQQTRQIGGHCIRVGRLRQTVCVAEGKLFVNNPDCLALH